jgi:hypothetical protein
MNSLSRNILLCVIISLFGIKINAQSKNDDVALPIIDGKINSVEWAEASVFNDFHMFIPKSDSKDYDSTTIFMKQTKDALYFAFKFSPRGKVISKSLRRDRSTDEENEFFILLDFENKNQNGYIFVFSFLDNQRDLLVYNQRSQSSEWDWVWECKSTIFKEAKENEPGYIETEVKIPVDKIQNKNKSQIGLNFQLFAYRQDGSSYWYSLTPECELMSLKYMQKINIIPFDEKMDINVNANPFAVGNKFNDSTSKTQFGGEFTLSLDKHKLKATYNTDESTLEADPYSFSFYNRPIYLEEKRPFFSKDLDIYRSPINLFYTRAIQNINYGFNYTYRSDKFNSGVTYLEEETDRNGNNRKFLTARPKYSSSDFYVGGFFLYSKDRTNDYQERIFSLDGMYRFPKNPLRLMGQYATNLSGSAYKLYGYYQSNDDGGPYADVTYNKVDKNFNASTLFNFNVGLQNNYDELSFSGGYNWVYDRKYFSRISAGGGYYRARQLSDNFNIQNAFKTNLNLKLNGELSYSLYMEYNMPDDYNSNGDIITRKNFLQEHYIQYLLGNNSIYAGYFFGNYFGSYLRNPYFGFNIIFFDNLAFNTNVNFISNSGIDRTILNTRMDYRLAKKLYLRAFYQKDTYSKKGLLNAMLQYEFFAGSNIYLVINLDGDKLQYTRRYFKIGYDFNF